jgi:L-fucono-1,5-lactonase
VSPVIDCHLHVWDLAAREYSWLDDSAGPLFKSFDIAEVEPELRKAGVEGVILVQAADTYEDTFAMLALANRSEIVRGVVGWVPLERQEEAAAALAGLTAHSKFVGMRHLIHNYPNTDWVVSPPVLKGLKLLAERDLVFEVVAVVPRHLELVSVIAEALPDLRIVIDHLAKPAIAEQGWEPWASLLTRAAAHPNVTAKVSGLNTAADPQNWSAADLQPYVDHAIEVFSPQRLMFGGDWPVATLAGTYTQVWEETNKTIAHLSDSDQAAILGGTAVATYRLPNSEAS